MSGGIHVTQEEAAQTGRELALRVGITSSQFYDWTVRLHASGLAVRFVRYGKEKADPSTNGRTGDVAALEPATTSVAGGES